MTQRYVWQRRQDDEVKKTNDYMNWGAKKLRKKLSKKLRSIQVPGRYIHVMDDDMFETVVQMLESKTDTDIQMARDIIFNSKMKEHHMNLFIAKHYDVILNFTPRKGIMTRYAKKMVRPEFYGKVFVGDLNEYNSTWTSF